MQVTLQRDHSLTTNNPAKADVLQGLWRNQAAREILGHMGVPIIETFNDSVPLWEFHRWYSLPGCHASFLHQACSVTMPCIERLW